MGSREPEATPTSGMRKSRKTRVITDTGCPHCLMQKPSDGMVGLCDGTRVCRKCGHVIYPAGSDYLCECIRCVQLRDSPPSAVA